MAIPYAMMSKRHLLTSALFTVFAKWLLIRRVTLIALTFFLIFAGNSLAAQNQKSLTQDISGDNVIYFGLLPYLSSAALVKTWRPLAEYIAKSLHKKVIIKTAPNFKTFVERTAAGRYHILMTAPHFAALAARDNGYRIIAGHNNELSGDIIVAKNSRFQSISDLRGKIFAIPGRLAAVSILAKLSLIKHGLVPDKDITIKVSPTHNTALIAVAEGQVDAAVAVGGLYRRINASKKFGLLRKLAGTDKIPHVMYIANPSLSDADFRVLQQALTQPTSTNDGIRILANFNNWGPIVIPTQINLERLKPVLSLLEAQIFQNEQ